jgi:hypothetical protein
MVGTLDVVGTNGRSICANWYNSKEWRWRNRHFRPFQVGAIIVLVFLIEQMRKLFAGMMDLQE